MKIGLTTSGLWKLRNEVQLITGMEARYTRTGFGLDAIAGWGHKPTASRARRMARKRDIPYIALEDGFLRSVNPGNQEPPLSLVLDRTGIYYDSRQPSDLEACITKRAAPGQDARPARLAMERLKEKRLSKYNSFQFEDLSGLGLPSSPRAERVLVVDQTSGDASIEGASARADTFEKALLTAVQENPGCDFLVKIHPETALGRKAGHFSSEQLGRLSEKHPVVQTALLENRLRLTPEAINPWGLLKACGKVYCVSSQLGFEALLAGCEVHCFGMPFYAGWGLTTDRGPVRCPRRRPASLEALFAAVFFDYCIFIDHEKLARIDFDTALNVLERRIESARPSG